MHRVNITLGRPFTVEAVDLAVQCAVAKGQLARVADAARMALLALEDPRLREPDQRTERRQPKDERNEALLHQSLADGRDPADQGLEAAVDFTDGNDLAVGICKRNVDLVHAGRLAVLDRRHDRLTRD